MLNNENGGVGMNMDVVPAYNGGNNGWGGDGSWWLLILFLFAFGGNGWGGGFGNMDGGLYPWLNNSQNINGGFRDQMLSTSINGIQNAVTSGFGDVQTALCGGFAGVNASVTGAQNALAQQMYTNQIADLERSFAAQTANTQAINAVNMGLQNCCCENRAATADLKYTVATEACADRSAISDGIRDVIANQTANTQAVLDKLCALELDGVKNQLAAAQRENLGLQNQVNMATMQASQTAQTAQILAGQAAEIDGVYNRLKNCPVPSMPVYGNQPIFSCNNGGCGCGVA
ncbi:MAG: hypothetical protein J6J18_03720 [Oscillospiraceae bacterium]|nr:hypothetical protein [Clostridia bacterium]MBP3672919.1 hypothetical protein [Oscillospiraceae bacterium]